MKSAKTTAAVAAIAAGLMAFGPVVGPLATVATVYAADYSDATVIDLSQLTAGSYEGYKVAEAEILDGEGNVASDYAGTTVTISEAGTYRITGSASDTNIVVKKGTTGVTLVLDNCELSCDYTAPIVAKKNTEVTIALVGTSTITDDEDVNNDEDVNPTSYLADYEGACVKAKDGATASLNHLIDWPSYPDVSYGVKFGYKNIGWGGKFYTFPYFLAFLWKRFLKEAGHPVQ